MSSSSPTPPSNPTAASTEASTGHGFLRSKVSTVTQPDPPKVAPRAPIDISAAAGAKMAAAQASRPGPSVVAGGPFSTSSAATNRFVETLQSSPESVQQVAPAGASVMGRSTHNFRSTPARSGYAPLALLPGLEAPTKKNPSGIPVSILAAMRTTEPEELKSDEPHPLSTLMAETKISPSSWDPAQHDDSDSEDNSAVESSHLTLKKEPPSDNRKGKGPAPPAPPAGSGSGAPADAGKPNDGRRPPDGGDPYRDDPFGDPSGIPPFGFLALVEINPDDEMASNCFDVELDSLPYHTLLRWYNTDLGGTFPPWTPFWAASILRHLTMDYNQAPNLTLHSQGREIRRHSLALDVAWPTSVHIALRIHPEYTRRSVPAPHAYFRLDRPALDFDFLNGLFVVNNSDNSVEQLPWTMDILLTPGGITSPTNRFTSAPPLPSASASTVLPSQSVPARGAPSSNSVGPPRGLTPPTGLFAPLQSASAHLGQALLKRLGLLLQLHLCVWPTVLLATPDGPLEEKPLPFLTMSFQRLAVGDRGPVYLDDGSFFLENFSSKNFETQEGLNFFNSLPSGQQLTWPVFLAKFDSFFFGANTEDKILQTWLNFKWSENVRFTHLQLLNKHLKTPFEDRALKIQLVSSCTNELLRAQISGDHIPTAAGPARMYLDEAITPQDVANRLAFWQTTLALRLQSGRDRDRDRHNSHDYRDSRGSSPRRTYVGETFDSFIQQPVTPSRRDNKRQDFHRDNDRRDDSRYPDASRPIDPRRDDRRARSASRDRSTLLCHRCQQPGHFREECPHAAEIDALIAKRYDPSLPPSFSNQLSDSTKEPLLFDFKKDRTTFNIFSLNHHFFMALNSLFAAVGAKHLTFGIGPEFVDHLTHYQNTSILEVMFRNVFMNTSHLVWVSKAVDPRHIETFRAALPDPELKERDPTAVITLAHVFTDPLGMTPKWIAHYFPATSSSTAQSNLPYLFFPTPDGKWTCKAYMIVPPRSKAFREFVSNTSGWSTSSSTPSIFNPPGGSVMSVTEPNSRVEDIILQPPLVEFDELNNKDCKSNSGLPPGETKQVRFSNKVLIYVAPEYPDSYVAFDKTASTIARAAMWVHGSKISDCLIDSGSSHNVVTTSFLSTLPKMPVIQPLSRPVMNRGIGGHVPVLGYVYLKVNFGHSGACGLQHNHLLQTPGDYVGSHYAAWRRLLV
ncbi:hypothetical protein DFJ73DRAFT_764953 [Zopfochytrium polystomum]|nr:hypothetical protein DFJ73DRAFT_764953 [Zopfochytrium polystomum]